MFFLYEFIIRGCGEKVNAPEASFTDCLQKWKQSLKIVTNCSKRGKNAQLTEEYLYANI